MGFLGGVFKVAGEVVGATAEFALKGASEIIGAVAEEFGENEFARTTRNVGSELGKFSNDAFKATGEFAGVVVDKTIDTTTLIGGELGGYIAECGGATRDEIRAARNVGAIVGGAAGGLLVGDIIGAGVMATTAATATASTGAAISGLHGVAQTSATLAQIGGGTLAAGGGGVAAGQAVLTGINVVATADGAVTGIARGGENKKDDTKLLL